MRAPVAVVGLGYVGLPLALEFGKLATTIGYDLSAEKVAAYQQGFDPTGEMPEAAFRAAQHLQCTTDPAAIAEAQFIIVAVPTPVDDSHRPDLSPIKQATQMVAQHMGDGATIVFESTVFPGVTEEICVPILERVSGRQCGKDFFVGYSPERINPGDKEHTLTTIVKVVSGQDEATLERVAKLYESIITAGVHRAASIKVAEAAKVIENTQRDVNIALMNEFALSFAKMGIDTMDVLEAAGTKWNFLPFRPGLVGGHCIGVDPYYLVHRAQALGHRPDLIMTGRTINNGMGKYVAEQTVKEMIAAKRLIDESRVIVMGLAFKEDCADLRNTRVVDIIRELSSYGVTVVVYDPVVDPTEAASEYGVQLVGYDELGAADAIIAATPHEAIRNLSLPALAEQVGQGIPFMDVKSVFDRPQLAAAGFKVWRL